MIEQEEIIRMAREAGMSFTELFGAQKIIDGWLGDLERFAALVREQAYREDKSLTLGFEVTERKCVDLTCQEITALIMEGAAGGGWQGFAERVLAAWKEKNK